MNPSLRVINNVRDKSLLLNKPTYSKTQIGSENFAFYFEYCFCETDCKQDGNKAVSWLTIFLEL